MISNHVLAALAEARNADRRSPRCVASHPRRVESAACADAAHKTRAEPDPIAAHRYAMPTVWEIPPAAAGRAAAAEAVNQRPGNRQRARVLASLIAIPDRPTGP